MATAAHDAALQRLLGGEALAPLRQRLRRHVERQADGVAGDVLTLAQLDPAEHEALALLLGRPPRATRSLRVDVAQLGAALRAAGVADSLRDALERLDGPIHSRRAQRLAAQEAWAGAVAGAGNPALRAWLDAPGALTLLKRLGRQDAEAARDLLARAAQVLQQLPASGMPLSQLAAQTLGNAHGLDSGQPAATVVLAVLRHASATAAGAADPLAEEGEDADSGVGGGVDADEAGPPADERARDVWARAGVLVNELARPALVLNLPLQPGHVTPWALGEPAYLSLRQLVRTPPPWAVQGVVVHVCENPNIVAIAGDRLGARCAPLACTDGMPAAAQRTLLTQLAQGGAQLRYHGDFDWPGIRIANHVLRQWPARPWRMSAADYVAAAMLPGMARHTLHVTPAVEASWDAALAGAMGAHGLAIAEEAVTSGLLSDLAADLCGAAPIIASR